jgi:hypothetical protein
VIAAIKRAVAATAAVALVGVALTACGSSATSSTTKSCGSASYTFPHTNDEAHAAMNYLAALNLSCATAHSLAETFLAGTIPAGWHASMKLVVVHRSGQTNTVDEEILTRGNERITGDIAN